MKIYATDNAERYLLVSDDTTEIELDTEARLLDVNQGVLVWWQSIHLIIRQTHAPWTKYDGSQDVLDELLKQVEEVEK